MNSNGGSFGVGFATPAVRVDPGCGAELVATPYFFVGMEAEKQAWRWG